MSQNSLETEDKNGGTTETTITNKMRQCSRCSPEHCKKQILQEAQKGPQPLRQAVKIKPPPK